MHSPVVPAPDIKLWYLNPLLLVVEIKHFLLPSLLSMIPGTLSIKLCNRLICIIFFSLKPGSEKKNSQSGLMIPIAKPRPEEDWLGR